MACITPQYELTQRGNFFKSIKYKLVKSVYFQQFNCQCNNNLFIPF